MLGLFASVWAVGNATNGTSSNVVIRIRVVFSFLILHFPLPSAIRLRLRLRAPSRPLPFRILKNNVHHRFYVSSSGSPLRFSRASRISCTRLSESG